MAHHFYFPPGWDASPSLRSLVPIYMPGWRDTLKCFAHHREHNTMSQVRAQTQTAPSGDEHTVHEATKPPTTSDYSLG